MSKPRSQFISAWTSQPHRPAFHPEGASKRPQPLRGAVCRAHRGERLQRLEANLELQILKSEIGASDKGEEVEEVKHQVRRFERGGWEGDAEHFLQ